MIIGGLVLLVLFICICTYLLGYGSQAFIGIAYIFEWWFYIEAVIWQLIT